MADRKLELDALRAALTRSAPAGFRGGENLGRETDAKVGKPPVQGPRISSAKVGKNPGVRISAAMVGKQGG